MRRELQMLFITLTLLISTLPPVEGQDGLQPVIHAIRDVGMMTGNLVHINDTFTLMAPEGVQVPISTIEMGFNTLFKPEEASFNVWEEGAWQPIDYREAVFDTIFHWYELDLPSQVLLGADRTLKITASYLFVDLVHLDVGGFSAQIPIYPVIPSNVSSFIFRLTLAEGAELKGVEAVLPFTNYSEGGLWNLLHETELLAPLRDENVTVTYTPPAEDRNLLDCELMERIIAIKPGGLRLEDTYVITNRGVALNSLHLNLPQEATNVKARDAVGLINSAINVVEGEEGYTDLRVSPRLALSQGDRWTFTAEYSMPREGYIEGEGGNLRLTYTSQGFPHYIRRFLVHAELPEGGAYATSNPEPVSVKKTSTMTQLVILDLGGIEPLESSEFYLEYKRSIMWNALRPLQWMLIAGGFIVILVLLSKRRKVEEERPIEVERVDIGEFLSLYRERLNLLAELEDLEMSAERRDIGRDKYNRRSAEIIRRQRELTSTLKQLERRIVRAYPVIGDRIREIRALEVELNKAETDLRSLKVRRRTRRVSRQDYQRRKRQCINERSKTRRSLERLISVLQAER